MDPGHLQRQSDYVWRVEPHGRMRVPAIIYATEPLIREMDDKVYQQACNVATLPGIVGASYVMPDAHWGYGFPIGGVAAFDTEQGGVISAGGVGFDISCGVRTLRTGLRCGDIDSVKSLLADALSVHIPAGVGSSGAIHLDNAEMNKMLTGGARWAVGHGYGEEADLPYIEESGRVDGARPEEVSDFAKRRQLGEMGTLGSGNHYLEVQAVVDVSDADAGDAFGLREGDVVVSIHCGSRGLGHQVGTEFLRRMAISARDYGITLPDRELACVPIVSVVGQAYLGAMRAAVNCALANRQIITHLARQVFERFLPGSRLTLLYDVSHNTCKLEQHCVDGRPCPLFVHRKGATRALGPGHPGLPEGLREIGQPVLIGGSMGTASHILVGTANSEQRAFCSTCHGAGRTVSRHAATRRWNGRQLIEELAQRGILVRSPSLRGVAEEAPPAYKNVDDVVEAAHRAGLARRVARLEPIICIKG